MLSVVCFCLSCVNHLQLYAIMTLLSILACEFLFFCPGEYNLRTIVDIFVF